MVSSPCVNICLIDPVGGLCVGCGRTVAEITAWRDMAEADRLAVMASLPARLSAPTEQPARERARRA